MKLFNFLLLQWKRFYLFPKGPQEDIMHYLSPPMIITTPFLGKHLKKKSWNIKPKSLIVISSFKSESQ